MHRGLYLRRLGAPQCIAHETFRQTRPPTRVDRQPRNRTRPCDLRGRGHDAAERFARSGGRVFVFTKRQGTGADVGEMLGRALANSLRPQESLRLRGAFFDEVTVYASPGDAARR
jgi:hypothetical protein